jgi:hypothetical protein
VQSIPRWLRVALGVDLGVLALNLGLTLFFVYEMYHHELLRSVGHWYLSTWLPFKLWLTATTLVQFWHILRDCRARERGEQTRFGLPHHGILMVRAATNLAGFPVGWLQTQMLINLDKSYEIYILGIANLVGIVLGTLSMQMLRWLERDVPPEEMHEVARVHKFVRPPATVPADASLPVPAQNA